jgi:hypothetical protein
MSILIQTVPGYNTIKFLNDVSRGLEIGVCGKLQGCAIFEAFQSMDRSPHFAEAVKYIIRCINSPFLTKPNTPVLLQARNINSVNNRQTRTSSPRTTIPPHARLQRLATFKPRPHNDYTKYKRGSFGTEFSSRVYSVNLTNSFKDAISDKLLNSLSWSGNYIVACRHVVK